LVLLIGERIVPRPLPVYHHSVAATVGLPAKILFWLILGTLSVFFAEVAGGSAPFPFFDAWGLCTVLPLYTLHIVFLAFAVVRPGRRIGLPALFCAGAVFGLYEAYITKVIWDPTWGERGLAVGGVFLAQTAMLVLYWHPFMAFIVPLMAGELLATSSLLMLNALPAFLGRALRKRRLFVVAAAAAAVIGASKAVNSPAPWHAAASVLSSASVPALLILLWLRLPGGDRRRGLGLRDLLPDGRQGLVIGLLLAGFYVATGILIRPASMPRTIVPHLSVGALYAVFGGLALGALLRAPRRASAAPSAGLQPARGRFAAVAAVFVACLAAVSAALSPLKNAAGALALVAGLAGMAAGLAITAAAVVAAIRPS
jgi:hypothetical protein